MRRALQGSTNRRRGAVMIEFAAVALLVLTVLFGAFETARLFFCYITITNAARAGIRYAVVHGANRTGSGVNGPSSQSDYSQVTTVVQAVATAAGMTVAAPTVTYSATPPVVGSTLTIRVAYTFVPVSPRLAGLGKSLSSTAYGVISY